MYRVLIVDDDKQVRHVLVRMLQSAGYEVFGAANGREAIQAASDAPFDVVVTDILMPEIEGLEIINRLRAGRPELPIVAISGGGRIDGRLCLDLARSLGANYALAKPVRRAELVDTVGRALGRKAASVT